MKKLLFISMLCFVALLVASCKSKNTAVNMVQKSTVLNSKYTYNELLEWEFSDCSWSSKKNKNSGITTVTFNGTGRYIMVNYSVSIYFDVNETTKDIEISHGSFSGDYSSLWYPEDVEKLLKDLVEKYSHKQG